MGSERRLLEDLEHLGVAKDKQWDILSAIETLNSAGDDLSDAISVWLYAGEDRQDTREAAALALTAELGKTAQAVGRLISYLNGS